ncbi:MAG: hypothetical protein WB919_06665 [Candidatus Sulfotelmatobacter sp.]
MISAVQCISWPGGYVIAIEKKGWREMNAIEETEFQRAMYGSTETENSNQTLGLTPASNRLVQQELFPRK